MTTGPLNVTDSSIEQNELVVTLRTLSEDRLAAFEAFEGRFVWQARTAVLVVGFRYFESKIPTRGA